MADATRRTDDRAVTPSKGDDRRPRADAFARAGAAVVWAVVYLVALPAGHVDGAAAIPVVVGIVIAVYPVIDLLATLRSSATVSVDAAIDVLAVVGLLVTAAALHTSAVLVAFGAWAVVTGLLQVARAWTAGDGGADRRPLVLSGGISTVVGALLMITSSRHDALLPVLAGYALLGAVLFFLSAIRAGGAGTT